MKKIGIVVGKNKDIDYRETRLIAEKLLDKGLDVVVPSKMKSGLILMSQKQTLFIRTLILLSASVAMVPS